LKVEENEGHVQRNGKLGVKLVLFVWREESCFLPALSAVGWAATATARAESRERARASKQATLQQQEQEQKKGGGRRTDGEQSRAEQLAGEEKGDHAEQKKSAQPIKEGPLIHSSLPHPFMQHSNNCPNATLKMTRRDVSLHLISSALNMPLALLRMESLFGSYG